MVKEILAKVRDFLITRRQAYVSIFDNANGEKVLRDLAKFCRANETTIHPDSRMSDILLGRREVWLRIQHQLQLSDEELWKLYQGNNGE